jgi:hypothetical protein
MRSTLAAVDSTAHPAHPATAAPASACCSCRCDRAVQLNMLCYWCQFSDHLDKCFALIRS